MQPTLANSEMGWGSSVGWSRLRLMPTFYPVHKESVSPSHISPSEDLAVSVCWNALPDPEWALLLSISNAQCPGLHGVLTSPCSRAVAPVTVSKLPTWFALLPTLSVPSCLLSIFQAQRSFVHRIAVGIHLNFVISSLSSCIPLALVCTAPSCCSACS